MNTHFRRLLALALLALILLSAACSYHNEFVIVNRSGSSVQVRYRLKRWSPESTFQELGVKTPAKVSLTEFRKAEYQWRRLVGDEYQFDRLTGTFTVNVSNDEVLLVDDVTNYDGREDQFDLASIKIVGPFGAIDLEGRQAQNQFRLEDRKYVLTYR